MTKYTFPKSNDQFKTWFSKFQKTFATHAKTFGFSPAQVRACKTTLSSWSKAYQMWQKAYSNAQAAQKACDKYRAAAQRLFSRVAPTIRSSSSNNGQFAPFGIPARAKPNGKSASAPSKTTVRKNRATPHFPYVKVAWSPRGKNTIWVGSRPGGTGKWPTQAVSATVQYRSGNGPWRTLNSGPSWPFVHPCGSKWASTQYRACFVSKSGTKGPWGPVVSAPAKSKAA